MRGGRHEEAQRVVRGMMLGGQKLSIERSYLAFDGVTDRGFASGAMASIGTSYTVAQRVHRPIVTGGTGAYFQTLPSSGASTSCIADLALRVATSALYMLGNTGAGATNWGGATDPASQATTERKVIAVKRTSGSDAKVRLLRDSGVEYTRDWATSVYLTPHSVAVGYRLNADGTASTQAGPPQVLSTIVVVGEALDADLVRYCAGEDPRAIWGSALWSYWPSSMLYYDGSNWRLPSLGSNATTMLLTGPTSADLVAI